MPERQSPHSDNDLIDAMQEQGSAAEQGRAGGNLQRNVGTRAELNRALDPDDTERPRGSDNPAQDEIKGDKTKEAIRSGQQG